MVSVSRPVKLASRLSFDREDEVWVDLLYYSHPVDWAESHFRNGCAIRIVDYEETVGFRRPIDNSGGSEGVPETRT